MATRKLHVGLHHVAIRTGNVKGLVDLVQKRFRFDPASRSEHELLSNFHRGVSSLNVLRSQSANIVVTSSDSANERVNNCNDIALRVNDLEALLRRADENRVAHSGLQRYFTETSRGVFTQLQSPVGGVRHTCISIQHEQTEQPQSASSKDLSQSSNPLISHIDHVTYACATGESTKIVNWYTGLFGLSQRNDPRKASRSYVVSIGDLGMEMRVLNVSESQECEKNLQSTSSATPWIPLRLVIAEPLQTSRADQISTFLRAHGGPGVQHVAFSTDSIADVIRGMNQFASSDQRPNGGGIVSADEELQLRPPQAYYGKAKWSEIESCGHDPAVLRQLGVLLDAKDVDDSDAQPATPNEQQRYLMQVFTKPVFKDDTLFFEVIQRCGTNGFGAANIKALWQAVQRFIEDEQQPRSVST